VYCCHCYGQVETPAAPESTTAKIAKKGGYFAYMKEKRQQ
jgi:hypothetical protein